ncbi:protein phosphatase 2C domain-containing protein [Agrobacterium sp. S2]|nr:protein phosphatase 2C domain-containing protein [Agrobacterium sp. S2]
MFGQFHYQVRGRAHQAAGTRGQDRTAYLSRGGVQALCLAIERRGSATHAELGAQAAADAGCALLVEHFQELVTSSADGVREAVLRHVLPPSRRAGSTPRMLKERPGLHLPCSRRRRQQVHGDARG